MTGTVGHIHLGNPGRLPLRSGLWDDPALYERANPMIWRQSNPGRGNSKCSSLGGEGASGQCGKSWETTGRSHWLSRRDRQGQWITWGLGARVRINRFHTALFHLSPHRERTCGFWGLETQTGNISKYHLLFLKPTNTEIYGWKDEQDFSWCI